MRTSKTNTDNDKKKAKDKLAAAKQAPRVDAPGKNRASPKANKDIEDGAAMAIDQAKHRLDVAESIGEDSDSPVAPANVPKKTFVQAVVAGVAGAIFRQPTAAVSPADTKSVARSESSTTSAKTKMIELPDPVAKLVNAKELPSCEMSFKDAIAAGHAQYVLVLDHAPHDADTEDTVAPGRYRMYFQRSRKVTLIRHSATRSFAVFTGLQSEKIQRGKVSDRSEVKTTGLIPDNIVVPNNNRCMVYGPAGALSADATAGAAAPPPPRKTPRSESGKPVPEWPKADHQYHRALCATPPSNQRLLVCPQHQLYDSKFNDRRIRVAFQRELTPHDRFALALSIQKRSNVSGCHMAGQDLIVILNETVMSDTLKELKDLTGVYFARSQSLPVERVLRLKDTTTMPEVLMPKAPNDPNNMVAWLSFELGEAEPTLEAWQAVAGKISAQVVPGAYNFVAAQVHLTRSMFDKHKDKPLVTTATVNGVKLSYQMLLTLKATPVA